MIKSILHPSSDDWRYARATGNGRRETGRLESSARIPYPVTRTPNSWWNRKVPTWVVVLVVFLAIATPIGAQLQQSGGGGSNGSVGTYNATAPTQATLSGGVYNSALPSLSSGQMGTEQLDSSARQIIVGAGTAGSAAGGVVSVQGVSGGTALPASESGTWTMGINQGTNFMGYTRAQNQCSTTLTAGYESGMAYLPTSSTAVTSTTTCVTVLILANTASSAQTVTVTDGSTNCNSAACPILSSFSLPAYSNLLLPLYGAKFTSGIKWYTGTANTVMGDIVGNQ